MHTTISQLVIIGLYNVNHLIHQEEGQVEIFSFAFSDFLLFHLHFYWLVSIFLIQVERWLAPSTMKKIIRCVTFSYIHWFTSTLTNFKISVESWLAPSIKKRIKGKWAIHHRISRPVRSFIHCFTPRHTRLPKCLADAKQAKLSSLIFGDSW